MKTQIDKIKYNPFRNIDKYPLNRDKIDALKQSIEETGLWPKAFCARKNPNKKNEFELVFGHHTLQAAKELGFKEVDLTVEELSDEIMIKRMANENMEIWGPVTSTILETVGAVKEYIENELGKYESWEDFTTNKNISRKFIDQVIENSKYPERTFQTIKGKGLGQELILDFLGKPWKQWQIQNALEIINNEKIEIEAAEKFNKLSEAAEMIKTFQEYEVDKEDQEDIVNEVKEKIKKEKDENKKINKKRRKEIAEEIIENKGYEKKESNREYHKTDQLNKEIITRCNSEIQALNEDIITVLEEWDHCTEEQKTILKRRLELLFDILKEHKEKINWNNLVKD